MARIKKGEALTYEKMSPGEQAVVRHLAGCGGAVHVRNIPGEYRAVLNAVRRLIRTGWLIRPEDGHFARGPSFDATSLTQKDRACSDKEEAILKAARREGTRSSTILSRVTGFSRGAVVRTMGKIRDIDAFLSGKGEISEYLA